jgi:hypothetical protein
MGHSPSQDDQLIEGCHLECHEESSKRARLEGNKGGKFNPRCKADEFPGDLSKPGRPRRSLLHRVPRGAGRERRVLGFVAGRKVERDMVRPGIHDLKFKDSSYVAVLSAH